MRHRLLAALLPTLAIVLSAGAPVSAQVPAAGSTAVASDYQARLAAHRAELEALARRLGWTLLVHHTDRPASEPLLALILRLQGAMGDYRWTGGAAATSEGGA